MSFKDVAKASFRDKLAERGSHYVEQWDTTVYFRPMTLKEMSILQQSTKGADIEIIVNTVIHRALDENDKPLFVKAERVELMREYDPDVLADIVIAMGKFDMELKAGN